MTTIDFTHLHLHSEFSLVDGVVRLKPLVARVKALGMQAVALTDVNNLFAAVKFYRAATAAGIKPIFGCDIWVQRDAEHEPTLLTLLCQNNIGYRHLTELISKGYREGQDRGRVIIQYAWLLERAKGLIVLSGGLDGDVAQALLNNNKQQAQLYLEDWKNVFPDRYYIELQRTGAAQENSIIDSVCQLAQQLQLPVVATNNVRFLQTDDFDAHEARVCIHDGRVLADPKRPKNYTRQQYLRSAEEMQTLFADIPSALENSVEIAKRCTVTLKLGENFLPQFPIPDGLTSGDYLIQQAQQALDGFLKQHDELKDKISIYQARLDEELNVINNMGFPGYFLIVADFIQWAKKQGIFVGPGRGSGAGSLVAFVLQITTIDPLQYDLLFERFLNPERVSMPDFDIDFCMEGRDRVIEYVANFYGRDSVAQIITYGTMAAKAVVRDVGRVLGHPYGFVDKLAKLIPFEIGMTLEKALDQEPLLSDRYEKEDEVKALIDLARKLEGITRNAGKHAGGVVIAPSLLTDFSPLFCEAGSQNIVTQFDKDDVEAVGLVKFDFLGLRTLTIMDWALQTINAIRAKEHLDAITLETLPIVDEASFNLLKACQTTAVFQLESRGMKDLIRRLQPDTFEDIIALVALFRPGPLQSGMVDDFIERKHGRSPVTYLHPQLEPILSPTYGVILYQEQVMQIAQVLAGYTLGGADLLRRAMGKKKPEEMAKQRSIFMAGAAKNNITADIAKAIFDLMEMFAGYGFNKSHSAAYALIAYQTAWLKAHYPAAFMAAVLSADMDNTDKVVSLIDECRAIGLEVLPPAVNASQYKFAVMSDRVIRYGLGAIKGVGEAAIELMIIERETQGAYGDLFDLCQRVKVQKVNRRVLDAMIRAGALDDIGPNRATLFADLDGALQLADQTSMNQRSGQVDLFGSQPEYTIVEPWSAEQRLVGEKDTLGLYLSGHPLDRYFPALNQLISARLNKVQPRDGQSIRLAGLIHSIRVKLSKRGDQIAFAVLDDGTARLDISIFSEAFKTYREYLVKGEMILIEADVSPDDFSGGYRVNVKRVCPLADAQRHFARELQLTCNTEQLQNGFVEQLKQQLIPFKGGSCPVSLVYSNADAKTRIALGSEWRVQLSEQLLVDLRELCNEDAVTVVF